MDELEGAAPRSSSRFARRVLTVVAASVMGVAGTFFAAAPASAATCKGSSCEGKDPNSYGCSDDAKNLDEFTLNGHRVELRWSKKCDATWTRVSGDDNGPADKVWVRSYHWVGVPPDHREFRKSYLTYVSTSTVWTKMVNGAYDARACEQDWLSDTLKTYCTGYH